MDTPSAFAGSRPCTWLRKTLSQQLIPNETQRPQHRRFFPSAKLESTLTRDVIADVLQCWCQDCQDHRGLFGVEDVSNLLVFIVGKEGQATGGAKLLFAILAYIEFPMLIVRFFEQRITDHDLTTTPARFDAKGLATIFGSDVDSRHAVNFHWTRFQFTVPNMSNSVSEGGFDIYPEGTILPFAEERLLGWQTDSGEIITEGNFGKVYAFTLMDGYGEFEGFPGVKRFARKELLRPSHKAFKRELDNLLWVKQLQDDHLIKVVRGYQHGNVYNLVFPLARTNLKEYLRDSRYHPYTASTSIMNHAIWPQVQGLARGLDRVLRFEQTETTSPVSMYGYHTDLKPANILVEESERLVITDFGMAEFKSAIEATSSRIRGFGGTEAYAPPEIDLEHIEIRRNYDVWSLGCVFLEILVFVVKGQAGVRELDQARFSALPGTSHQDDRYFHYLPEEDCFELKPAIMDQMRSLPLLTSSEAEKVFIGRMLNLILGMLQVKATLRHNSQQVCVELDQILDDLSPAQTQPHVQATREPENLANNRPAAKEDVTFGAALLDEYQPMIFNIDHHPQSGNVIFIQEQGKVIIKSINGTKTRDMYTGDRSALRVIPEYALRCRKGGRFEEALLCLTNNITLPGLPMQKVNFAFGRDIVAATTLQEVITGQQVMIFAKIKTISLSLKRQGKSYKRWSEEYRGTKNASAIQIWKVSPQEDVVKMAAARKCTNKRLSRSLATTPNERRIIIFLEHAILSLRLEKNVRIKSESVVKGPESATIEFIPTDKTADDSFQVSLLHTPQAGLRPALPSTFDQLKTLEEDNGLECRSLSVCFHSTDEAKEFYKEYVEEKRRWSEDMKTLEIHKSRHGSDFRYFTKSLSSRVKKSVL